VGEKYAPQTEKKHHPI